MLGVESEQRPLSNAEIKYYLNLINNNVAIENVLQMVFADGWHVGYEACLSEGCEEEEDW